MFRKILIANRGEIACRVMRTARSMGMECVAVFSDADRNALHVREADEAIHIGPAAANESYLRGERIIQAALDTGAEAIHPGYGFLSENPGFVEAVEKAGLAFIGPSSDAIRAMGLKDAAKKLMREAGVPVTPGYDGDDQSPERLKQEANAAYRQSETTMITLAIAGISVVVFVIAMYVPNIVQGVVQGVSVTGGMETIRHGGQAATMAPVSRTGRFIAARMSMYSA